MLNIVAKKKSKLYNDLPNKIEEAFLCYFIQKLNINIFFTKYINSKNIK